MWNRKSSCPMPFPVVALSLLLLLQLAFTGNSATVADKLALSSDSHYWGASGSRNGGCGATSLSSLLCYSNNSSAHPISTTGELLSLSIECLSLNVPQSEFGSRLRAPSTCSADGSVIARLRRVVPRSIVFQTSQTSFASQPRNRERYHRQRPEPPAFGSQGGSV